MIDFQTAPDRYRHWKLRCDGPIATLAMDVDEEEEEGDSAQHIKRVRDYGIEVDFDILSANEREVSCMSSTAGWRDNRLTRVIPAYPLAPATAAFSLFAMSA